MVRELVIAEVVGSSRGSPSGSGVAAPDGVWAAASKKPRCLGSGAWAPGVGAAESGGVAGVGGQPGGQVCWALEVEQGIGQGFQLLHW